MRPHGYRGQQDEKGRYLSGQMSTRVGKGLIGVRSPRGIEWYRSPSGRMPIGPSSRQYETTCPGELKCKGLDNISTSGRTASGQGASDSAGRGELNGIGSEASAWL